MLKTKPIINKKDAVFLSDFLKFKRPKNGISSRMLYLYMLWKKYIWSDQKNDIKINVKKINIDWLTGCLITYFIFSCLFWQKTKERKKNIIIIAEMLFEILIKKANKNSGKLDQESPFNFFEINVIK